MPSIAWFPFAIILFGISTTTILFVIILGAAPSIANGLIAGVDYTPPLLLRAGKMMGLRRLSLYRHLILPASLPAFVAGLKQGWAFAWRSLMAGELLVIIANQPSLGVLLSTDQDQADMQSATSIIIVILILGIIVRHAVRHGRPGHPPPLGADWDRLSPDHGEQARVTARGSSSFSRNFSAAAARTKPSGPLNPPWRPARARCGSSDMTPVKPESRSAARVSRICPSPWPAGTTSPVAARASLTWR